MYDENVLLLITAIAQNAADEYRSYREILKNRTLNRKEREYYNTRANETLLFFESNLFTLAFPGKGEYIIEQLKKEKFG